MRARRFMSPEASIILALELRHPSARTIGKLEVSPALGILVARGSLDAGRWLDSGVLLDKVEETRDRLGLLPGDPARDLYELMLDRDAARRIEELGRRLAERPAQADEEDATDSAAIEPPRSLLVPSFSSDAREALCVLPDAISL